MDRSGVFALPEQFAEIAASLRRLAGESAEHYKDLEGLERHLTVLEEKTIALARSHRPKSSFWTATAASTASSAPTAAI